MVGPAHQFSAGIADTVVLVDLTSGSNTTWFHRENDLAWLVGLNSAGLPIVLVRTTNGDELWLVLSPGNEKRIYSGLHVGDLLATDTHGVWFISSDGIYLYSEPGGVQKVSNRRDFPAGECI
jgi:hypothetical protein